jgi:hypothetical protein
MTQTQLKEVATVVAAALLLVALIILGPIAVIWSLNTLFAALAIPYTFWSWLAVIVLSGAIKSKVTINK